MFAPQQPGHLKKCTCTELRILNLNLSRRFFWDLGITGSTRFVWRPRRERCTTEWSWSMDVGRSTCSMAILRPLSGFPDGIFGNQKLLFGWIFESLAMEDVGLYYGHLVYFSAIWHVLSPFGIICGHLVHFPPFRYALPRKIWQPWPLHRYMHLKHTLVWSVGVLI
jgi:hypothetical protein